MIAETKAASGREDPFSIEIDLGHPSCDPLRISEEFSLDPSWSWRQGARLGNVTKTSSRWYGQLARGSGVAEYEAALAKVVSFLGYHETFFAEFSGGGGEIEIVLNHPALEQPKGVAFDLQLSPVFLAHLANRKIGLRVQAWSDNPSWTA
jgi:hypothetical protein